ncbi:hypothetical protein BTE77_27835 [Ensifer adhaerens]|nr:hypothetical protein BTE77_27835 [Ensifer adhaerens]
MNVASQIHDVCSEMQALALAGNGLTLPQTRAFVSRLIIVEQLASSEWRELCVHRAAENGHRTQREIERAATEQLVDLVYDPEGKVIRPDFGRKS